MGRLIEIILAEDVREMSEIVRDANFGCKKHGTRATVLSNIVSCKEKCEDYPDLPVPGQRIDRAQASDEWVEEGADRPEVICVMSVLHKGILAKCVDAREEEQAPADKSELEVGKNFTGDSDDTSDVGVEVPLEKG